MRTGDLGREMGIQNDRQLAVAREKLQLLVERVELAKSRPSTNAYVRELTLRSLKSMANQLREEIARYTAGA